MNVKSVLKFIGNLLTFILVTTVFVGLVVAIGSVAIILLMILGRWIGIGATILTYAAIFFIYWETWGVLAWIVGKIANRIGVKSNANILND